MQPNVRNIRLRIIEYADIVNGLINIINEPTKNSTNNELPVSKQNFPFLHHKEMVSTQKEKFNTEELYINHLCITVKLRNSSKQIWGTITKSQYCNAS